MAQRKQPSTKSAPVSQTKKAAVKGARHKAGPLRPIHEARSAHLEAASFLEELPRHKDFVEWLATTAQSPDASEWLALPLAERRMLAASGLETLATAAKAKLNTRLVIAEAAHTEFLGSFVGRQIERLEALLWDVMADNDLALATFSEFTRARQALADGNKQGLEEYVDRFWRGLRCVASAELASWLDQEGALAAGQLLFLSTVLDVSRDKAREAHGEAVGARWTDGPVKGAQGAIARVCGVSPATVERDKAEFRDSLVVFGHVAAALYREAVAAEIDAAFASFKAPRSPIEQE